MSRVKARSDNEVAGSLRLVTAALRRDRVRIAVWVGGIVVMIAVSAQSVKSLFPTQADLDAAAASSDNPALIAFQGPPYGLDTLGGQVSFQIGAPGLVFVGLMALLMTGRLTRTEEEAGRLELVRSLPVGRHAPTVAAGLVVAAMCVAIGALSTVALVALGLPVAGSISFGLGYTMVGAVFTAITLVTAQMSENPRLANGLAGAVLGASFIARAIGDTRSGWLSWISPIGWSQQLRPFADERWWPLLLPLATTAALVGVAVALQNRRDLGAGLIAPRPGPARAGARLATPFALAVRLQRGAVVAWTAGTAALALVYGAMTSAIESFIEDNPQLADFFVQSGGDLTTTYLATSARITALIGSGYSIQSMLRLRSEETHDRTEPVLATRTSRTRYWAAHAAVAVLGSVVVLAIAGLVLGASAAAATGDGGLVADGAAATAAYLPATMVMIGLPAFLIGAAPRWSGAAWGALVIAFVVTMFGTLLDLPNWVTGISPFEHVALVPAESVTAVSVVGLTACAAALLVTGAATYRRRDLPV
jgi:ABC-2 type transport system permease protein